MHDCLSSASAQGADNTTESETPSIVAAAYGWKRNMRRASDYKHSGL